MPLRSAVSLMVEMIASPAMPSERPLPLPVSSPMNSLTFAPLTSDWRRVFCCWLAELSRLNVPLAVQFLLPLMN